jgi:hypothetical protein
MEFVRLSNWQLLNFVRNREDMNMVMLCNTQGLLDMLVCKQITILSVFFVSN